MKIAAAAFPLTDRIQSWTAYEDKLSDRVARSAGADLLVFPEYGAMELALIAGEDTARDPLRAIRAVSDLVPAADALHARLATEHGAHILAASAPVFGDRGPVNRARLFAPGGGAGHQDKQIMTPYERTVLGIVPGDPLTVFETALGRIGVLICYDSEFPLLARALVEAGADLLLVPACTEGLSGHHRVATGARARALENQCVAVHAPTVGTGIGWCPIVYQNRGAAAVYGPPDPLSAETGVIAAGAMDAPGWIVAEIDLGQIGATRSDGQTHNYAHWSEQSARLRTVRIETLT